MVVKDKMTNTPIVMSRISGEEFVKAMGLLETLAVESGFTTAQFFIALLGMAIVIQNPDIEAEDLQKGVKGASEWIAMFMDSLENPTEEIPKELVN